jgi:hypothetical protein
LPRSRYGDPIPASSVSYLISKSLSEANIFFLKKSESMRAGGED